MKTKRAKIISIAAAAVVLIAGVIAATIVLTAPARMSKHLDLGHKYLLEMSFEEAKAEFNKAIKIDPTAMDAAKGYIDAYIDTLVDGHDYDTTLEVLRTFADYYADSDTRISDVETLKQHYEDLIGCLSDIAKESKQGGYENIFEIMHSDRYERVIEYVDDVGEIRAFETPNGKIGIYNVSTRRFGNHMVYVGDYNGDKRDGNGIWLAYYDGNNYYSIGEWKDDLPQGHQVIREWSDELAEEVVYRIIEGDVINGLWNGTVTWSFEIDDYMDSYYPAFDNGYWVILSGEDEWGHYEVYNGGEDGSLVVSADDLDETVGVLGYTTSE